MSATFTWAVPNLRCLPSTPAGPNYVVSARWECVGVDGEHSFRMMGVCGFQPKDSDQNFVPYENLTQDQILGWIWANGANKEEIEAMVQKQIDRKISPVSISPPLPWAKNS